VDRAEEQRLLQLAQRGDADAFAALYRAHVQAIYRYIAHRVSDSQLAEDLTGDVFTRALQSLGNYRDRGRPFVAWLYRIAHARVVDHYRQTDRRPVHSELESETVPVDDDMDEAMIQQQAAQTLRAAIAELTGDQQQVIVLRFIEGHRTDKVAQLMGKQPNAIKALQHRALRALAKRLEKAGVDVDSILAGLA
jgi:RNA polymerase sigma-70 factor (ECF subfamily)